MAATKFIAEREAEFAPHGNARAFNRALRSMAGKSKEAPAASTPHFDDG
jgi:hypothetical protein